jgi:hypothetical protein
VQRAFVEFADLMIEVVVEGFFYVGLAEVVVIFHRGDRPAAWAVDAREEPGSKTNVLSRQCFAMVPLAFDIRFVLNWVTLRGRYQLPVTVARKTRRCRVRLRQATTETEWREREMRTHR